MIDLKSNVIDMGYWHAISTHTMRTISTMFIAICIVCVLGAPAHCTAYHVHCTRASEWCPSVTVL